ncbi:hypothetical protein D3C75_720610 [compost metagenome]
MGNDPVGHESAIASTGNPQTRGIDIIVAFQCLFHTVQKILAISTAEVSPAGLGEILAITEAAARVQQQNRIALRRQRLHLMAVSTGNHRMRPAMDVQDQRNLLTGHKPRRLNDPALKTQSIRRGIYEFFRKIHV